LPPKTFDGRCEPPAVLFFFQSDTLFKRWGPPRGNLPTSNRQWTPSCRQPLWGYCRTNPSPLWPTDGEYFSFCSFPEDCLFLALGDLFPWLRNSPHGLFLFVIFPRLRCVTPKKVTFLPQKKKNPNILPSPPNVPDKAASFLTLFSLSLGPGKRTLFSPLEAVLDCAVSISF